jgi:hypothetical protein
MPSSKCRRRVSAGNSDKEKGVSHDTDYSFVAHVSAAGDQLIRIWDPEGSREDGYQTEEVPGIGPVPGGKELSGRQPQLFEPRIKFERLRFTDDNRIIPFMVNIH